MTDKGVLIAIMLGITSLLFSGCASSPPSRFFVLNPLENPGVRESHACPGGTIEVIGISTVSLPRYLDRPQIMTKAGDNEFRLSELNLWAEPLKDNIARVIACNLYALPCVETVTMPKAGTKRISYRLSIDVIHLYGTLGGQAVMEVRWSIADETAKNVLISKTSKYAGPVTSSDYSALVSAYNRLLDSFSSEITRSLAAVVQGKVYNDTILKQ